MFHLYSPFIPCYTLICFPNLRTIYLGTFVHIAIVAQSHVAQSQ